MVINYRAEGVQIICRTEGVLIDNTVAILQ